ncbi:hypothetical protein JCM19301_1127 [Jejuia pallidilutea]|uniref:Uncharacterized protein n=1 Tax=Jejuia pallidilutea TaxID=504487 RepID=A0A090WMS6_9FLAO|nr:hypothetical protein JCM19301_1127 [Jejuia pallidilutea]
MEESKFSFSEDEQSENKKDENVAKSKEEVKKDAQGLFASISKFLNELLDFRDDTDRNATIEAIKKTYRLRALLLGYWCVLYL